MFLADDALQEFHVQRFHIDAVRNVRVSHDGRRVAVDQHDLEAFLAQGTAGLGTGIVELRRLSDDDGAGTDDQDFFDILQFRHYLLPPIMLMKRWNRYSCPPGPGHASGWYWTVNVGESL